ncbi:MAG: M42 family peptidase [Clostridia bacterium]|nr:M42 family peptidase [Clostridia bacterium]
MLKLLQTLCCLDGVSGNEDAVRNYIRTQAELYADSIMEDVMGNLIIFKKGKVNTGRTIMLAAHMDEVGLIITDITDDGFLRFACSGGIDSKVLLGTRVRVNENRIPGVIGSRATHLNTAAEEEKLPLVRDMYIDIGAVSREEAEKLVQRGDFAAFDSEPRFFGNMLKAKAIDDRIGCAVLLKLLQEGPAVDAWFVFTVQEEQGLRGATAAAYRIKPDIGIVLETTTAADLSFVKGAARCCTAGKGPVMPILDGATLYSPELIRRAYAIAAEKGIPVQTKTIVSGGTDAGIISKTAGGAKMLGIAAPVRYLHTPSSAMAVSDVDAMLALTREILKGVSQ